MRSIIIVQRAAVSPDKQERYFTGVGSWKPRWSYEYPDAEIFNRASDAKRAAKYLRDRSHLFEVVENFGLENETVIG